MSATTLPLMIPPCTENAEQTGVARPVIKTTASAVINVLITLTLYMTKFVAQVALKNNNALVTQPLTRGDRVRGHMELGRITALFRYPVKSMAGELLDVARLGWHGIEGDRRFAFRRLNDKSAFPWLSASKLPQLVLYKPFGFDSNTAELLPTHVRTPDGKEYELRSDELREEISNRYGSDVELMNLNHGIFDEASISVISRGTVHSVARESGRGVNLCDLRRFRPNVVLETNNIEPFAE